jgi:excisionase family DNA binding protein
MDRALLDDLDAGRHVSTIAARMHLTEESVRWRVRQLGRSLRDGWRSRQEVAQVLGVGRRAVDRWWKDGLLPVRKHGTRWTRILEAELETFVRAQAGLLFAPGGVRDARLRRLAEIGAAANARAVREEAS